MKKKEIDGIMENKTLLNILSPIGGIEYKKNYIRKVIVETRDKLKLVEVFTDSDYKNILVILPTAKGHPLLNRQILYTAITRTKGNTYILSNKESLEAAASTNLTRDTNINLE